MRISDWSSDVCSSDLQAQGKGRLVQAFCEIVTDTLTDSEQGEHDERKQEPAGGAYKWRAQTQDGRQVPGERCNQNGRLHQLLLSLPTPNIRHRLRMARCVATLSAALEHQPAVPASFSDRSEKRRVGHKWSNTVK